MPATLISSNALEIVSNLGYNIPDLRWSPSGGHSFCAGRGITMLGKIVTVTIDRPLGSFHPKHPDIYYSVNYGFVEGIPAPDGQWQDAYVLGVSVPLEIFTGYVAAVIHRLDDVEDKWVVLPEGLTMSEAQIREAVHFQERFFHTEVKMASVFRGGNHLSANVKR